MAPGNVANRLLGFISTNLKKTKRQSKRLSSRFVVGKDDDFEKENLNLSRSKSLSPKERETKTTEKKRARDDASMVREMREYLTKRVKEEDGGKRDEKGYVEYLEYFEAAENVVRENERLRELLAKKNGGTETDDEDVSESWRKITIFLGQERAMRLPKMVISSASNTYARSPKRLGIRKLS